MLTLNPRSEISQAVMVVPIFAPMITLMDSVRESRDALAKLTTMSVVAEEDCITAVIRKPVEIPRRRLEVMAARMDRIRLPARSINASLMTFMPKRKRPSAPSNPNMSAMPYTKTEF